MTKRYPTRKAGADARRRTIARKQARAMKYRGVIL